MDTLFRRRMMMGGGVSPTPVSGTPYIRGGANGSYIDTGITPDETTKIIIWARNWNPGGASYTWLFGSRVANQDSMFGLTLMNNENLGKVRACFGAVNKDLSDKWPLMSHYHKYELSADGFYVDDVLVSEVTVSTFSNNYNIHIFGLNNAGSRISPVAPIDVCAAKIYKNNTLVRDFTAVRTPSIGLYDEVSDTVFTNAGTGSFTYGGFDPDAYTPLEYISTSGSAYFLTPAVGAYSLPIVAVFYPTSSTAAWYDAIGGRDATNRCQIFTGNTTYSNARLYGILGNETASAMYSSSANNTLRNKKLVVLKNNNVFSGYMNNSALGSSVTYNVSSSYSTNVNLGIGATWTSNTSTWGNNFIGRYYYIRLGGYNFVPGKVDGVAGMYDTYNDVFYPSISGTNFSAGNAI